jgi:hypothetical protein
MRGPVCGDLDLSHPAHTRTRQNRLCRHIHCYDVHQSGAGCQGGLRLAPRAALNAGGFPCGGAMPTSETTRPAVRAEAGAAVLVKTGVEVSSGRFNVPPAS